MSETDLRFHPARARWRGAARHGVHLARRHPDAGLHAGRHGGDGEGDAPAGGPRARRRHPAGQRVPPDAAARRGTRRVARRLAQVHELAASDPHRFRGLPGHVAGAIAQARRDGRDVPVAYRRVEACADARAIDRDPGAARLRHPDAVRRVHPSAGGRQRGRTGDGPLAALGATVEDGLWFAARPCVVRDRPGRHGAGSTPAERRGPGRDGVRRLRAGRARGRRNRRT